MKRIIINALLLPTMLWYAHAINIQAEGYPITPVPFTSVKVWNNSFWGQRLETSRKVTIPLAFKKCEETGRYTLMLKD